MFNKFHKFLVNFSQLSKNFKKFFKNNPSVLLIYQHVKHTKNSKINKIVSKFFKNFNIYHNLT